MYNYIKMDNITKSKKTKNIEIYDSKYYNVMSNVYSFWIKYLLMTTLAYDNVYFLNEFD